MKTADREDGKIYDRNCKAAFNAAVSNGIHRTSKSPPPHKNLRKQSTQRIILLQSHRLTLTGSSISH